MGMFRRLFGPRPQPQPAAEPETPEQIADRLTATAANDFRACEYRVNAVREIASLRPPDALARLIAVHREGSHPFDLSRALEESITALDPRALQEHRKRSSELASAERELLEEIRRCGDTDVLNRDALLEQTGQRIRAAGGKGTFTLTLHIEELIPRRSNAILAALYLARHAEPTYDLGLTLRSLRYTAQHKSGRFPGPSAEIVAGDRYGWSDVTYRRVRELVEEALRAGQEPG
ncbi:MAG TPA: hypothetical protein VMT00_02365 [Thermoanaerobaculia bacterium]|nr:hypothetical protein [Thermoanaerobaculia bacterium]